VPEIGKIYNGKVKSIVSFGAFIEILPNKDGLLNISEIDWRRIQNVEEVLKVGDIIDVKLIDIDAKTGNLKLSRKALLPKPEKMETMNVPTGLRDQDIPTETTIIEKGPDQGLFLIQQLADYRALN
jgi:polyribonucleotide nucleotidyltransferase